MAILNFSMLGGALVNLWLKIIEFFDVAIGNYAWSIILLTLIIKIIMSPLDLFNKKMTRKNTMMQAKIQPEIAKLQQKYGNDKNTYNQKMSELYKSNNYNVVGTCLFMLINLTLTLVVFISLFSGLNQMASNKIVDQYEVLQSTYNTVYNEHYSNTSNIEESVALANDAVAEKYKDIKYSWLWIDNVWKSDMPTNSIPTFTEYLNIAKKVKVEENYIEVKKLSKEQKQTLEAEYKEIMDPLRETSGKANGYLILFILTLGTAFLTQWLTQRKQKMATGVGTGKIMMFIIPIMLGFFAIMYNAVFALYMLTSQIITLALTPLIDKIIDISQKRAENKAELAKAAAVPYRRVVDVEKAVKNKKNDKKGD